jgi:hypothetical protein
MERCQCAAIIRGKENVPENSRGAKSDGQKAVSSVGSEDKLFGFCLRFVVGIERLFGNRHTLINVNEILAVEDHTGRAGVNELWDVVLLGGINDSLGAIYVYLPVEGWVLNIMSWRRCVDNARCTTLEKEESWK